MKPIRRILIPRDHWTPIPDCVFTEELPELKQKNSAALYLCLIDRAFHNSGRVTATRAELARSLRMDARVVSKCLKELQSNEYIRLKRQGVTRSHVNKNCWTVPAATKESRSDGWTPMPGFIFRDYIPAYHNAVLLALLMYFQHRRWNNSCWMGVNRLSKTLSWSPTRVRNSLRTMSIGVEWRTLKTNLPQPAIYKVVPRTFRPSLGETRRPDFVNKAYSPTVRHYRVRAIEYSRHAKNSSRRIFIPAEFLDAFGIALDADLKNELSSIFRYGNSKSAQSPARDE